MRHWSSTRRTALPRRIATSCPSRKRTGRRPADEGQVLASRAARARLAIAAAERAGAMPRGQLARASAGDASTADSPTLALALHRVIRYLRRLETKQLSGAISDALWHGRASDMPKAITTSGEGGVPQERFTLAAFAWGGVWYQTLATAFTHPECRMSIQSGGTSSCSDHPSASRFTLWH